MSQLTAPERWVVDRRRPLALLSVELVGLVVGLWHLARRGPLPGEAALTADLRRALLREDVVQVIGFVESVAVPAVAVSALAVATVVVASLTVLRRMGARHALVVLGAAGVVVANAVLKDVLGPTEAFVLVTGNISDNYPSGHVSYVTAVFGAFAWLGWVGRQRELSLVCAAFVVMIGPFRVARGPTCQAMSWGGGRPWGRAGCSRC